MKKLTLGLVFCFLSVGAVFAQQNYLITKNSAGAVRLGMTVAQARQALQGFKLSRTSDGDGQALIAVKKNGKTVMNLFAGEEDSQAKINEKAKIEFIEVWDTKYQTANGIRPKMTVKNAERILGRVERVFMSEIESREFVLFKKKPQGLLFRADVNSTGKYSSAGIYPPGKRSGTRYAPIAYIVSVQISAYWSGLYN